MLYKAYFTKQKKAKKFSRVHGLDGHVVKSNGEWYVRTERGELALDRGAYRILPVFEPEPRTTQFTIKIVPEEYAAEAERCDRLGIPYTGPVIETATAQGTMLDITPEDAGMEPLF